MKAKRILTELTPFFVMLALSAVSMCVYLLVFKESVLFRILQVAGAPLIALIVPLANLIFRVRIPFAFNVALTAFAFFAMNLAAVYLYRVLPDVDKVLHTLFGVLGGLGMMILLLYGKGEKLRPWCFFVLIMLGVLGLAALWEIYEYLASSVLGADLQRYLPDMNAVGNLTVNELMKNYDPLWDTMWDIIVAMLGVVIFYLLVFVDKLFGYKVCKSIYRQVNEHRVIKSCSAEEMHNEDKSNEEEVKENVEQ